VPPCVLPGWSPLRLFLPLAVTLHQCAPVTLTARWLKSRAPFPPSLPRCGLQRCPGLVCCLGKLPLQLSPIRAPLPYPPDILHMIRPLPPLQRSFGSGPSMAGSLVSRDTRGIIHHFPPGRCANHSWCHHTPFVRRWVSSMVWRAVPRERSTVGSSSPCQRLF
jgi:hypothetical protein